MSGRKSQQEALRRVNEGLYKKLNDLRAAKDAEINELRVARDNHARLKQEMKRKADTTIKAKDAEIAALKTDVLQANRSAISAQQIAVKKMDEATRLRAENQRLREGIQKEIACLKYFPLQRERLSALLAPSEEWEPLEAPALGTTPEDLKRGLLHAQSLSRTGTFPAPVEWQDISQVKQQRPPIKDDDLVNLHCLDDMPDICVWMAKRGHLWYIASDFFKISTF